MPDFRRRDLLAAALAAAVLPVPPPAAVPLPAPAAARVRPPRPGLVEVDLEARVATVHIGGRPARLWAYDGMVPGPLIEARAGDTVRLRFTNQLPEPTNLHFHGLHVTPDGHGDNIWLSIAPGEAFTYELALPANEGGLFWYHPHPHRRLAHQLWQG